MKYNPEFKKPPQGRNVIRDFDAPQNVDEMYIQRLSAHMEVINL